MKKIWKILEIIIFIALIVIAFINICFGISKYIKKDDLANVFGYTYMIVQSNSMAPAFKYGDKIVVKLNAPYKEGDIVTFKEEGVFVTHRVVKINADTIITRGDANNADDSPIKKSDVVGVVVWTTG